MELLWRDIIYSGIIAFLVMIGSVIVDENDILENKISMLNTNISLLQEQLNNKDLIIIQKDKECEIKLLNQSLSYEKIIYEISYNNLMECKK